MQTAQLNERNGHVVIVSIPRLGHVIPMLDLAKHLSTGCNVTFVVSQSILDKIKEMGLISHENTTDRLEFIGLLDSRNDESKTLKLDDDINRMNVSLTELLSTISVTSSSSSLLFTRPITRPVHMIISDIFNPVPLRIAHERHIRTQIFMPCNFENLSRYIKIFLGELVAPMSQLFVANFLEAFTFADGIICNSIAQLEKHAVDRYRQQSAIRSDLPVRFVAPLFPEIGNIQKNDTTIRVKQWLDAQWQKSNGSPSVIYIAFGSIVSLTREKIAEISHSVASHPYIWSLKNDLHKYLLPSTNDDVHLVLDWLPQRLVLSHSAVKLFISHGGWNSVLESMSAGKPMLILPMFGDQFLNGQRVNYEFGTGRVIQDTNSNGEMNQYLQELFDPFASFQEKARETQMIVQHAREHTSQEDLNEIVNMIRT
ncbi:unnamed protein product [Adineta ricciae]|uniref:UDP-glucuronosyltransferase n=1 Tax=Adineta ricciae TaxID=249248 RepID=A0A815DP34_ADIRI|nr:unnamed protein product [Adineta ricciae]CAF1363117.1 unnamed protein product [Adineta ricciae]